MGLFGDMFKDLTEMGSPLGKIRGKFADLSNLLTEYSFGDAKYSPELTKQKILVTFNEIVELANKCSSTDKVRMYFPSKTVEPIVLVALKAAEYWIDFVMEQGRQFTNSLAIQLIERAEYDQFEYSKATPPANALSQRLPNLLVFMKEMASNVTNFHQIIDDSDKIEYKSPILTYGRTMGYNHYVIEKVSDELCEVYQLVRGNKQEQLISSKKLFKGDMSVEEYLDVFNSLATELMSDPKYIQIATKGLM